MVFKRNQLFKDKCIHNKNGDKYMNKSTQILADTLVDKKLDKLYKSGKISIMEQNPIYKEINDKHIESEEDDK